MKNLLLKIFPILSLFIASFCLFGCESESANNYASISTNPRSATLLPGQSVAITASGGWDYKWSLENSSLGFLNQSLGNQVIYTATKNENNSIYVTGTVISNQSVTVEVRINGGNNSGSSSNSNGKENDNNNNTKTQNNLQTQNSTPTNK